MRFLNVLMYSGLIYAERALPPWVRVRIFNGEKLEEIDYIAETGTGDLYWDDERWVVALKCVGVFFLTPLYTLGVVAWNSARLVNSMIEWNGEELSASVVNIARAFFYGVQVMLVTLTFPIDPYLTRKWEARIENQWLRGASYENDFRKTKNEKLSCLGNCIYGIENAECFYLAWCFQKRGQIGDGKYRLVGLI